MDSLIVSQCYKNPTKKSGSATEKNFKATCKFCPSRVISGNINNSSNFLKHIEEQHSIEFKKFQLVKQQVGPRKRKNDVPVEAADTRAAKKQTVLQMKTGNPAFTQKQFESALCTMITTDMAPLAIVERQGFLAFCNIVASEYVLPSRRTLGRGISEMYTVEKQKLIVEMQNAEWLSATADAWSSHKRAFMGVTVHYVDPSTYEMRSMVLGVRRFKHSHTSAAIAKIQLSMLNESGIRSKVQNIVTDNAANFAKAFKVSVDAAEVHEGPAFDYSNESGGEVDEIEDMSTDDEGDLNVISVFDILAAAHESEEVEVLPPHKLCGNHTLNLVASTDTLQARSDKSYKRTFDRAMAKVQALSNAVNRSPKLNDLVEEITGTTFTNPTSTRWSSSFHAVQRVVSIGLEKVKRCQVALRQEPMTDADMLFLGSYAKIMRPLVLAMDLIQGDKATYLGHLIPTIMGLQCKLRQSTDKLVAPLVKALIAGIDMRFKSVLSDKDHLIATVLLQQFKLNFLPEDARLDTKRLVLANVQQVKDESPDMVDSDGILGTAAVAAEDDNDLFSFMNSREQTAIGSPVSKEVDDYLASKATNIQSLKDFPTIARAFQKANSTLPSSAAVERLFSVSGMILTPRGSECRTNFLT